MNPRELWTYDYILEKKVLKFINENDGIVTRDDIRKYGNTIDIPERTLSDILRKFVKQKRVYRIKWGHYVNLESMKKLNL